MYILRPSARPPKAMLKPVVFNMLNLLYTFNMLNLFKCVTR